MENWMDKLVEILGSGAVAAVILSATGYLLRDVVSKYFGERFSHESKRKIIELENQFTQERSEINDIRQILISGVKNRNEKLVEKQIAATQDLWQSTIDNNKHKLANQFLRTLNIEEVDSKIGVNKMSDFIEGISRMSGVQKLIEDVESGKITYSIDIRSADLSRPFVSPLAWALYSAHSSVIWHGVMTIVSWTSGIPSKMLKNTELVDTVKKALPYQEKFLDKYGVPGCYLLLEILEEELLKELKRYLIDGSTDEAAATKARAIMEASRKAQVPTDTFGGNA